MKPTKTLPVSDAPRKLSRWFLLGPWIAFAAALVIGGGAWVYLRFEAAGRMDAEAERLRAAGYDIVWESRKFSGFPFRLDVDMTKVRIAEPSGWAVEAPQLEAEAAIYSLGRWVASAPQGISLTRPGSGTVNIQAKVLRASISGMDVAPPRLSVEGKDLIFTAPAGAKPYPLRSAKDLQIHTRRGPDDQAQLLFRLDGAAADLSALMGRISQGKPIAVVWDGVFSKASALKGADWPSAVRAWTAAGGKVTLKNANMTAGDAQLNASAGTLGVGFDGRLRGDLQVELRQAPRALIAMGETGATPPQTAAAATAVVQARQGEDAAVRATITFEAGQATLGPVSLGAAPRIY